MAGVYGIEIINNPSKTRNYTNMYYFHQIKENPSILSNYKSRDRITLICDHCQIPHSTKNKHNIISIIGQNPKQNKAFCSLQCFSKSKETKIQSKCFNCNSLIYKTSYELNKNKNTFCSKSCSVTYTNKNKTIGDKRSKLEYWLETKLKELYPNLDFTFNNREICSPLELDIYIPSLKLAFELNGIFHYEPIFGEDKLARTQQNDNNKFQRCIAEGISLCLIDTSSQKKFTEKSSEKFLKIITDIINNDMAGREGIDPSLKVLETLVLPLH